MVTLFKSYPEFRMMGGKSKLKKYRWSNDTISWMSLTKSLIWKGKGVSVCIEKKVSEEVKSEWVSEWIDIRTLPKSYNKADNHAQRDGYDRFMDKLDFTSL